RRPERLAQAPRRAEAERHPEAGGIIRFRAGKSVAGNRDQRNGRRVAVEYPDRLETPHVRHEDIDDHQIERAVVQRGEAALTAVRDRDPEPALPEPYAYGKAGVPVVIDYQDATHDPPPSWRGRPMRLVGHPCQ